MNSEVDEQSSKALLAILEMAISLALSENELAQWVKDNNKVITEYLMETERAKLRETYRAKRDELRAEYGETIRQHEQVHSKPERTQRDREASRVYRLDQYRRDRILAQRLGSRT